ncbi:MULTISPECIES: hypothetical protein [unclassified Streptomyces]
MDQVGDKPEEVRKHLEEEQAEAGKKQPSEDAERENKHSTEENGQ